MSNADRRSLPSEIRRALNDTGAPWSIEVRSKHFALRLGDEIITHLSKGTINSFKVKMVIDDIRRWRAKREREDKSI